MYCLLAAMRIFASEGTILLLPGIAGIAAAIPAARAGLGTPGFAFVGMQAPPCRPPSCALAASFLAQIALSGSGPLVRAAICFCTHVRPAHLRPDDPK